MNSCIRSNQAAVTHSPALYEIPRALVRTVVTLAFCSLAAATDIVVQVRGVKSDTGEVGCALFASERGFPMNSAEAKQQWHPANRNGVTCRFEGLTPGTYAIAVSHDTNGNRRTDTKMFGIPVEDWGVSNNVRPRMRAPKFREAAVTIRDGEQQPIEIEVAR